MGHLCISHCTLIKLIPLFSQNNLIESRRLQPKWQFQSLQCPKPISDSFCFSCKHHFIVLTFPCNLHVAKNKFNFYLCLNICHKSVFWHRVKNYYRGCTCAGRLCLWGDSAWQPLRGDKTSTAELPVTYPLEAGRPLDAWEKIPRESGCGGVLWHKSSESPSSPDHIPFQ